MPSISSGIQIALQAVLAQSQAIEIVEHNVANANTIGYRRQSAVLSATTPTQIYGAEHGVGAGQRGTGVSLDRIQRFSIDFFDDRYRNVSADAKNWQMQQNIVNQVESTLSETSANGLLPTLDQFWSGWQTLAADPTNMALRASLLDDTSALTNGLNKRADQLLQMRSDQDLAIISRVDEINSSASQIAELNGEIARVLSIGEQPNDLMDKRDLLLDRLSELAGAKSTVQKNGTVLVTIDRHILVTGNEAIKIPICF